MKTTVELSDALMRELKAEASRKNASMRMLMETALRLYLDRQKSEESPYSFANHSFKGNGVCEGVEEGAWERIRSEIYEGRGG